MFRRDEKKSLDKDNASLESQEVRPFSRNQVIICATHGKLYAVHKKDGSRLWRQGFPTGVLGGVVSIFVTDDDTVLVGGAGKTACLDLFTGASKWVNTMKGFGYEEVGVIASPSRFLSPQSKHTDGTDLPDAPPSYDTTQVEKQLFFSGSKGKVLAIDPTTGEEAWKYNCPKGGYSIPALLVEPPSQNSEWSFQVIYIGCGRTVYCLRAGSGEVLWATQISNSKMGLGYMTLATPWSSRLAAEAHTTFSNTPHAQKSEIERQNAS